MKAASACSIVQDKIVELQGLCTDMFTSIQHLYNDNNDTINHCLYRSLDDIAFLVITASTVTIPEASL
jgi:hypothetical protein